ncbi:molybdate transport system substrate-binding protein [Peptoniphilus olsenii]|uniref:Molybdate transport system substrate-binding protein n=1 Tax=Peptoniphilus olsenii TaxID=411570 RepID=A0ABV2JDP2_9FIRM
MNLKKILLSVFIAFLALTLISCSGKNKAVETAAENSKQEEKAKQKDLVVFAAASMTDVLEDLKTKYEEENNNVNLIFNFDSSGTLKTQIVEGADCDVFISAAQKQINELDPNNENYNGKVSIQKDTRIDLLENKVTLVVAKGNAKNIDKFEDLNSDKVETIALGNEDVPVGQYSEEILKNLGIFEKIQPKVTLGTNVREVASWVSENTVDAGIVYATDAKAYDLEVVAQADDSMLDNKVIYPAAVLDNSKNKEEAENFLEFLQTEEAAKVFEDAGFTPVK